MDNVSRRDFLKLGAATAALPAGLTANAAAAATAKTTGGKSSPTYMFFNSAEAAFIEAATERLIPPDATGPSARQSEVPRFIDRQLSGAWGTGERLYRSGPWREGSVSQGYQLPFTPAELFRSALHGITADVQNEHQRDFAQLAPDVQDAYLKELEAGKRTIGDVPSQLFFQSLWEMTIEGYFGDPVYGGNKDMAAWSMVGFPGAYADYYDLVDQHNLVYRRAPISLGQDGRGMIHLRPVNATTPPGNAAAGHSGTAHGAKNKK